MLRKASGESGVTFHVASGGFLVHSGGCRVAAWLLRAFFLVVFSASAGGTSALPLRCSDNQCGLRADGAYANLVIGRLEYVGSAADMATVFHWAKAHRYWKNLPLSAESYLRDVQLVTISVPKRLSSQPVTLFMLQSEYAAAPYHVGDLVRYAPHDAAHDEAAKGSPAYLALFHGLSGCVATLCQKNDKACFARYRQGAFNTTHGQSLDLETGRLIQGGIRIDPTSLLPTY